MRAHDRPASTWTMFVFTARERSDPHRASLGRGAVEGTRRPSIASIPTDKEALEHLGYLGDGRGSWTLFMLAFQLFLGIVGSLTLVVGGIGVSNIMNVVGRGADPRDRHQDGAGSTAPGSVHRTVLDGDAGDHRSTGGAIGLGSSPTACAAIIPALGAHRLRWRPQPVTRVVALAVPPSAARY